ncbi:MAG: hypothetical protein IT558_00180 [Alphaproteobacteria bacterium]|nr:hypothetical protein [Alphaproteobacteria bacterium]
MSDFIGAMNAEIRQLELREKNKTPRPAPPSAPDMTDVIKARLSSLTGIERAVIEHVADGQDNDIISEDLGITLAEVRTIYSDVKKKLGLENSVAREFFTTPKFLNLLKPPANKKPGVADTHVSDLQPANTVPPVLNRENAKNLEHARGLVRIFNQTLGPGKFTKTECEIAACMITGMPEDKIADLQCVVPAGVRMHRGQIFNKLGTADLPLKQKTQALVNAVMACAMPENPQPQADLQQVSQLARPMTSGI